MQPISLLIFGLVFSDFVVFYGDKINDVAQSVGEIIDYFDPTSPLLIPTAVGRVGSKWL